MPTVLRFDGLRVVIYPNGGLRLPALSRGVFGSAAWMAGLATREARDGAGGTVTGRGPGGGRASREI